MEVVKEVDAARVAQTDALLAGAHAERLEQVALAGAGIAGNHHIVVAADEVESSELDDHGLVELGLEVEVERLECLVLLEAAAVDAPGDALLELVRGLGAEDVLEQRGRARPLAHGPRETVVELVECARQSEELEVSSEPLENEVGVWGVVAGLAISLGHGQDSWGGSAGVSRPDGARMTGSRSYAVRSCDGAR